MKQATLTTTLPLPTFYDAKRVGEIFSPDYQAIFEAAIRARTDHNVRRAATDKAKIALVAIDAQVTFCLPPPWGQLPVAGAVEDTRRTAEFIYRYAHILNRTFATLDTHTLYQIFHPAFIVDKDGNHPAPGTMITGNDIKERGWRVNADAAYAIFQDAGKVIELERHFEYYVNKLDDTAGKYALIIWPFHAMLGDVGHILMPALSEAMRYHALLRGNELGFEIKGGQPLTEAYSPIGPEVTVGHRGQAIGQKNTRFLELLANYDAVIVVGQAKSHCVRAFVDDVLGFILAKDTELAKRIYLAEDGTSPVVIPGVLDFTDQANEAFAKFAAAGMNVVRLEDPIENWPGMPDILARVA